MIKERAVTSTLYALTGHYGFAKIHILDEWFIGARWEDMNWRLRQGSISFLNSKYWQEQMKNDNNN